MALSVTALEREFQYNGITLPDPNPDLSVSEVQAIHAATYPELATAKPVTESSPTRHGFRQITTFTVAAGTKG